MAIVKSVKLTDGSNVDFSEIKDWYNNNLAPDVVDLHDQKVYENIYHKGKWAGGFQCTQSGAQRFFKRAKPKSIVDIATLTSIYRPGPLAAKVDQLYVDARNGKEYDWGDKRINEVLKKTNGLIIFQEQVMQLAHEVAGFPLEECDKLLKAIMKRTIGGGEDAKKKAQAMRDSFVSGCVKNGYSVQIAENLYDRILWFAGYGFNAAHAVSYAIDSYFCAWLMTFHETEWVCAYLQSMSKNPDDRSKAFSEIRAVGYKIVNVDINYAERQWTALPGKQLMPSFSSYKGIGETAIDEILQLRPFSSIEDLFWNEDGSWRLSKFNKRALEALILVQGLDSLKCVGENCIFANYKQMHDVIIGHWDELKKSTKKDPFKGRDTMRALALETAHIAPWTREEKMNNVVKIVGSADVSLLIPDRVMEKLIERNVPSIDDVDEDESDVAWFCVQNVTKKTSKNKKQYLLIDAIGPVGKVNKIYVWSVQDVKKMSIMMAPLEKSAFGYSTNRLVHLA